MHIVFQQEDVKTLSKAFELDESLRSEIFEIKDDYAVGPLKDIYSEEGIDTRKEWWRKVLAGNETAVSASPHDGDSTGRHRPAASGAHARFAERRPVRWSKLLISRYCH